MADTALRCESVHECVGLFTFYLISKCFQNGLFGLWVYVYGCMWEIYIFECMYYSKNAEILLKLQYHTLSGSCLARAQQLC